MKTMLTLRPISDTDDSIRGVHDYLYEVGELPPGERALIGQNGMTGRWQILLSKDGVQEDWAGGYENAEDILAALQIEVEAAS